MLADARHRHGVVRTRCALVTEDAANAFQDTLPIGDYIVPSRGGNDLSFALLTLRSSSDIVAKTVRTRGPDPLNFLGQTVRVLPSDGELEILRVLWRIGPATVREVHEHLPRNDEIGYNTVGKLLQIMLGKGLVSRDAAARAHVFQPLVTRDGTQRRLVDDLAGRAYGGSAAMLALHALKEGDLTEAEIAELRALLAELEG